ncbi:MAG: hypothetical protein J6R98_06475, partial [Bacteroidaceae bacterium]|nr:hypothetical protein [Bacteroidaceae bacterium]
LLLWELRFVLLTQIAPIPPKAWSKICEIREIISSDAARRRPYLLTTHRSRFCGHPLHRRHLRAIKKRKALSSQS